MSKLTKKDRFDINVGVETLSLITMAGHQLDKLDQAQEKGLFSILNLEKIFHKQSMKDFELALKLKYDLLGKDYIEYCCILAIGVYKKCGTDLIKSLNNHKKGLVNSNGKSKALEFRL